MIPGRVWQAIGYQDIRSNIILAVALRVIMHAINI